MPTYRNDPLYPSADLSPAAIEAAMARGRKLRAEAFRGFAVALYRRLAGIGRPAAAPAAPAAPARSAA